MRSSWYPLDEIWISVAWIAASLIVVLFVASQKNRSVIGWGIVSVAFSPLPALLALAAIPAVERYRTGAPAAPQDK